MPTGPPESVFPALVAAAHIAALIAAWKWRLRRREGKEGCSSPPSLLLAVVMAITPPPPVLQRLCFLQLTL